MVSRTGPPDGSRAGSDSPGKGIPAYSPGEVITPRRCMGVVLGGPPDKRVPDESERAGL